MINNVILIGRITKDVELKASQNGTKFANFTIAVDRIKHQEGQPSADFISCTCWNKIAEILSQYPRKGCLIAVEGRLQTRSYSDQSGKKVYVTEVMVNTINFLDKKKEVNQSSFNSIENTSNLQSSSNPTYYDTLDIAKDDLPF